MHNCSNCNRDFHCIHDCILFINWTLHVKGSSPNIKIKQKTNLSPPLLCFTTRMSFMGQQNGQLVIQNMSCLVFPECSPLDNSGTTWLLTPGIQISQFDLSQVQRFLRESIVPIHNDGCASKYLVKEFIQKTA